jgi:hypothetical protein
MRVTLLASCLLLFAASGCSKFSGEWLEEGTIARDGTFVPAQSERRMALKFTPPATVRYGSYFVPAGVVEHQTVQYDTYFTMNNFNIAQTGGMTLKPQGKNRLISYIGDAEPKRFVRVRGNSVFPPAAILPSLAKAPHNYRPEIEPEVALGG